MTQKLTLTIKPETIRKAKEFAKSNNTSVSKMFESFVESQSTERDAKIAARLEGLARISGSYRELRDLDIEAEIQRHREEKYLR